MIASVFVNGRVFDGQQVHSDVAVVVRNGHVDTILPSDKASAITGNRADLRSNLLAPGLIDIQVNSGGGVMFNDAPSVEILRTMGARPPALWNHGLPFDLD